MTQGTMSVLNRQGDMTVTWDSEVESEVEHARQTFDRMRRKGHAAYRTREGGQRGEQISRFDPEAESILLAPPLAGG